MAIVAIVGRPNVGKSSLFNRFTESREAIVDEVSGVTRDRHYGQAEWNGVSFSLIDTGGYAINSDDVFEGEIRKQVELAIEEANLILFLVDVDHGLTDLDAEVAQLLRKSKKTVFLVANKADNTERTFQLGDFYKLGLGEVYPVSAINGYGTGDLLDKVVEHLPAEAPFDDEGIPRISLIGRPNVGKSSLTNTLLGKEQNIVTDIPGTTRDSIHTRFTAFDMDFYLVDTAGFRKKSKATDSLDFYATVRTMRSIEESDVCLLLIDAVEGFNRADLGIFWTAVQANKGVIILVNKWDLLDKDNHTLATFEREIKEKIKPFTDVPVIFVSAVTKQRVLKALETALEVYKNRTTRLATSKLNDVLLPEINYNPPPVYKGKEIKIKYVMQLPTYAPAFAFFCNLPQYIKDPYKRFLENKIRSHFNFSGVPIKIFFRKK
ncbi:MAG: ribosome biogenesis GTPase Der [Luteibaculaceae bacterium]